VLQCVAVCCSVLQCVAVCCSVLQCDLWSKTHTSICMWMSLVTTASCHCGWTMSVHYVYTYVYTCMVTMDGPCVMCNILRHTATHCNTLQHTATHVTLDTYIHMYVDESCHDCVFVIEDWPCVYIIYIHMSIHALSLRTGHVYAWVLSLWMGSVYSLYIYTCVFIIYIHMSILYCHYGEAKCVHESCQYWHWVLRKDVMWVLIRVCCSVLQCVAVCCNVLQCVAAMSVLTKDMRTHGDESVLQCVAVCCSVLQCVAVCCSVLHWCGSYMSRDMHTHDKSCVYTCVESYIHVCCSVLQCVAACCSVLQCVAVQYRVSFRV